MADYQLRHLAATDKASLIAFHERCSEETHYLRFFGAKPHLSENEASWFCAVDGERRGAVVATLPVEGDEIIVGVGRWDLLGSGEEAEVAFVVADDHQGHGIGRALVEAVLDQTRAHGVEWAVGAVLPHNTRMRMLLSRSGWPCAWRRSDGVSAFRIHIRAGVPSAA